MINFRKCLKPWSDHPCRCFVVAFPCVPPQSHSCNSISVLQWALIDLFSGSTRWLAKSHSFFSSLLLLPQSTQARRWHAVLFIILSLVFSSYRSLAPHFSYPVLSFPFLSPHPFATCCSSTTMQLKSQISI